MTRLMPPVLLFILSPLVGEFLLGNMAIDALHLILFIAPLYGGGAVLVRELARQTGRGWPTMFVLALAYGVIEEGFVTQSLIAPTYFGYDLISIAYISGLGIGAWWTVFVLSLHSIWSIVVPIAIVESLFAARARQPWLGTPGLLVVALVFLLGCVLVAFTTYQQEQFIGSPGQFAALFVTIAVLVAGAFALGRRTLNADERSNMAPDLARLTLASLVFASAFVFAEWWLPGWWAVAFWLSQYVAGIVLLRRWSVRRGWGQPQILAVASGALLMYAWQGFPHEPIIGSTGTIDLVGNVVFALAAVLLLLAAWGRVWRVADPHLKPAHGPVR